MHVALAGAEFHPVETLADRFPGVAQVAPKPRGNACETPFPVHWAGCCVSAIRFFGTTCDGWSVGLSGVCRVGWAIVRPAASAAGPSVRRITTVLSGNRVACHGSVGAERRRNPPSGRQCDGAMNRPGNKCSNMCPVTSGCRCPAVVRRGNALVRRTCWRRPLVSGPRGGRCWPPAEPCGRRLHARTVVVRLQCVRSGRSGDRRTGDSSCDACSPASSASRRW
jgi:hypothetical protein